MIKFFRKIREKLISENKISKYLLYATGEILLVMIGILLALQVNNWNETRKLELKENEILKEILRDIEETNSEIVADMRAHMVMLLTAQMLKDQISQLNPDTDQLSSYYRSSAHDLQIYPKTSGFETLKSQGLEIITNDSLRKNISDLYQLDYTRLTKFGRLTPESSIIEILLPYTVKHFRTSAQNTRERKIEELDAKIVRNIIELKSIDDLKNDEEFFVILEHTMQLRNYKISNHRSALINGIGVVEFIEKELNINADLYDKADTELSDILVGQWESTNSPGNIVTFFEEDDQLYSTSNFDEIKLKYYVLSDSRFWNTRGDYLKVNRYGDEYTLHENSSTWKKIKK